MTIAKRLAILLLPLLLFAVAACDRAKVATPTPIETSEAPSPSPTPASFELEGVVVEASGSAAATTVGGAASQSPSPSAASPSPSASASASAGSSASPGASPEATTGAAQVELFKYASPGSIALRLTSFNGAAGPCVFNAGDTLVVSYTGTTTFEPADITDNAKFPNSIQGFTIGVKGDVAETEQGCLLISRSVNVVKAVESPSPAKKTTKATPKPTPKPSATPSGSPSPSASPSSPTPPNLGNDVRVPASPG